MTFTYTTEYRLGRRGRIKRSSTGIQALFAIAFDLVLGFSFGFIGFVCWMFRVWVTSVCRFVFVVLSLPFRAVCAVLRSVPTSWRCQTRLGVIRRVMTPVTVVADAWMCFCTIRSGWARVDRSGSGCRIRCLGTNLLGRAAISNAA